MFTNNYIKFKKFVFLHTNYTVKDFAGVSRTLSTSSNLNGIFVDIGAHMGCARCAELSNKSSTSHSYMGANTGIYFGSGSTPAAASDYTLDSPITSGLNITNPSSLIYREEGEGKYSYSASFILANTSDVEINIYEIGLFGQAATYSSGTYSYYPVLMERTVLSEPITIPAGESKLVTYKITFNQTLNVE